VIKLLILSKLFWNIDRKSKADFTKMYCKLLIGYLNRDALTFGRMEQCTWAKATKNSCSLVRLTAGRVGSLPCFDVQSLYA